MLGWPNIWPTGITAGCMVILSSILNSGSYFSIINVFVYETILTSLPPSLLILLLLLLLRYKKVTDTDNRDIWIFMRNLRFGIYQIKIWTEHLFQDFDVIMCSLVIFFFCFGFLLIWQALTESTFFTKKVGAKYYIGSVILSNSLTGNDWHHLFL